METGQGDIHQFAERLFDRWLQLDVERRALKKNGAALLGYQWKALFLPDGTSLRTSYAGTKRYAKVVGEQVVADDRRLSPSQFASLGAPPGRNAWRVIWIRFPGKDHWVRAHDVRELKRTASATSC